MYYKRAHSLLVDYMDWPFQMQPVNQKNTFVGSVVILAAGRGRRLMPFTKDRLKCLAEVGGKPILYKQICGV